MMKKPELKKRSPKETFLYLVFPLIGAGFIGWLLTLLDKHTLTYGVIWVVIGFIYLSVRTAWLSNQNKQVDIRTKSIAQQKTV